MLLTVFERAGEGRFTGSDVVLGGHSELVLDVRVEVFHRVAGRLHFPVQIHRLQRNSNRHGTSLNSISTGWLEKDLRHSNDRRLGERTVSG